MNKINNYQDLVDKVNKTRNNLDLSAGEDLSIAVMNLISIEEHLFFTSQKTNNPKYLTLLNEIRQLRTELLKEIIQDYEGEVWCISKHLLAASMRLIEVGTKELKKSGPKKAESFFSKAYQLYSLFWGLNLNLVKVPNAKNADYQAINYISDKGELKNTESVFSKLGTVIQKALDCCRE